MSGIEYVYLLILYFFLVINVSAIVGIYVNIEDKCRYIYLAVKLGKIQFEEKSS